MRSIPQATSPNPYREGKGQPTCQQVIAISFSQQRRSVNETFPYPLKALCMSYRFDRTRRIEPASSHGGLPRSNRTHGDSSELRQSGVL
jgi:hypothetical protein